MGKVVIRVENNSAKWLAKFDKRVIAFLEEVKSSVSDQTMNNTPVDTGALRQSFGNDSYVDKDNKTAYVGSSLEYSIWVEFGTGEYALKDNGRKGGWAYKSAKDGKWHYTKGNVPRRMLYKAVQKKKPLILAQANKLMKEIT